MKLTKGKSLYKNYFNVRYYFVQDLRFKFFLCSITAYQALTDDTAKRNWEKYGNPDGPGAMSFGIALPSWIVDKENSVWVLGLYALVFMVALPTTVGIWWYRSIQYSSDKVSF